MAQPNIMTIPLFYQRHAMAGQFGTTVAKDVIVAKDSTIAKDLIIAGELGCTAYVRLRLDLRIQIS